MIPLKKKQAKIHPETGRKGTRPSHLYDSATEARLLRQLLQRLGVGIVVLSELSLHHLRSRRENSTQRLRQDGKVSFKSRNLKKMMLDSFKVKPLLVLFFYLLND